MKDHRTNFDNLQRVITLPRRELAPFVRNFMFGGFDSLDVHLPASADPQLVIYLRGGAVLLPESGHPKTLPLAFVSGPLLAPRRFQVMPGSCFISATFRPSGFLQCFGVPVNYLGSEAVPLENLLAPSELVPLLHRLHQAKRIENLVTALEAFLLRKRLLQKHELPFLPAMPVEHLLRPTGELAASLELSTRQFERRFLMHHGVPLRDYRRLARFSTVLSILMRSQPATTTLSMAAQEAGYVDQPHFTRDFRQFVGDTPASFLKNRFESGSGYGFWQFNSEELQTFIS